MKYLYLLLFSVVFFPISQVANGLSTADKIGQVFNDMTAEIMDEVKTKQVSVQPKIDAEVQRSIGMDQAIAIIISDSSWSGTILDPSFDTTTKQGYGDHSIPFECNGYDSMYSVAIQKRSDYGDLTVAVAKDGKLLGSGFTNSNYGTVTFSGYC